MAPPQASSLFIFLTVLFGCLTGSFACCNRRGAAGMFVFGSSLVDNGNNNFLANTSIRADYSPYGVDFPSGPSGRFSNGRNPIDVLGELLKLRRGIPPFLDPTTKGHRILHGVSYASGGSGILDQTRPFMGSALSMSQQVSYFERDTLPRLRALLERTGRNLSAELPKYLFVVGTGGNDYLLNYFLGGVWKTVSPGDFTVLLTSTFISHLKKLYSLGARKFVLLSVQPIGCVPVVKAMLPAASGACVETINEAALLFNSNLSSLADSMRQELPGSHLVYVNSYKIITDIIRSPTQGGFGEANKACCETSPTNGVLCKRGGRTCDDRNAYVFFDGLHPTDAVNLQIAEKAYSSHLQAEAYPMNIKQLVHGCSVNAKRGRSAAPNN